MQKKIDRHLYLCRYIYSAFWISIAVFLFVCMGRNIWPFGDRTILKVDLFHQYAPYIEEVRCRILAGKSLVYSWETGMGKDFIAQTAYYAASPLNILIFLFPEKMISEMIAFLIMLKISLSSASFTYYLREHFRRNDLSILIFGLLYGFCAFVTCYYWNIMWLDTVALFPLTALGCEKLIRENKITLYYAALTLTMVVNFYLAVLVCLLITMYAAVTALINEPGDGSARIHYYAQTAVRFIIVSILCALTAMIILAPVASALRETEVSSSSFPPFYMYPNIWQLVSAHFLGARDAVLARNEDMPNVYTGVLTLVLLPLYYCSSRVSRREKALYSSLLGIMLVCSCFSTLDYMIHGFHFPANLPHRFTFVYSFILLSMAYRGGAEYLFPRRKRKRSKDVSAASSAPAVPAEPTAVKAAEVTGISAFDSAFGSAFGSAENATVYNAASTNAASTNTAARDTSADRESSVSEQAANYVPVYNAEANNLAADADGPDCLPQAREALYGETTEAGESFSAVFARPELGPLRVVYISAAAAIAVIFLYELFIAPAVIDIDHVLSWNDLFLNILMIAAYLAILTSVFVYRERPGDEWHQRTVSRYALPLLLVLVIGECLFSFYTNMYDTGDREDYIARMDSTAAAMGYLDEKEQGQFFRTDFRRFVTINEGSLYHFNGFSQFSSLAPGGICSLLQNLGVAAESNSFRYYDNSPLLDAIFRIRYCLTDDTGFSNADLAYKYKFDRQEGNIAIGRNDRALPLGFMVSDHILDWNTWDSQPFDVQNDFVHLAAGVDENIFTTLPPDLIQANNMEVYDVNEVGDVFSYSLYDPYDLSVEPSVHAEFVADKDQYLSLYVDAANAERFIFETGDRKEDRELSAGRSTINVGFVTAGERIKADFLLTRRGEFDQSYIPAGEIRIFAAGWNDQVFQRAFDKMNSEPLQISEFTDTRIHGTVNASEKGILFTSIPYTSGWSAYVDGKRTEKAGIGANGLIGIPVSQGSHDIVLEYKSPFLLPAFICTLLGPLLFFLYWKKTTGWKMKERKTKGRINTGILAAGRFMAGRKATGVTKTSGIMSGEKKAGRKAADVNKRSGIRSGKKRAGRKAAGVTKTSGIMSGRKKADWKTRSRLMPDKISTGRKTKGRKETSGKGNLEKS